jgi:hypothetical protein
MVKTTDGSFVLWIDKHSLTFPSVPIMTASDVEYLVTVIPNKPLL